MKSANHGPLDARRVSTTVRLEQADGTNCETTWDDSGQVTTRCLRPDGSFSGEEVASFDEHGAFVRDAVPRDFEQATSAFGSLVERSRYGDGMIVEQSFDHDARLRRVHVVGCWGTQTMELWPDGSRALTWQAAGLRGRRHWDAAGETTSIVEWVDDAASP
jgi:YD repeat-containing protein